MLTPCASAVAAAFASTGLVGCAHRSADRVRTELEDTTLSNGDGVAAGGAALPLWNEEVGEEANCPLA